MLGGDVSISMLCTFLVITKLVPEREKSTSASSIARKIETSRIPIARLEVMAKIRPIYLCQASDCQLSRISCCRKSQGYDHTCLLS
jgi:hypothetical protein